MLKKLRVLMLCLVLLVMMVAGCGTTKEGGTQPVPEQGNDEGEDTTENQPSEGYSLPLSSTGETLSIGTTDTGTDRSVADGLPVYQEIEKKTGVKIKWELAPSNEQYNTTMQTRLASGTDLPDIIQVPGDPIKYANDGLLIQIDDLINKYAPNIKKWFEKEPSVKKMMTAPDGKIYTLPRTITEDEGAANDIYNTVAIHLRRDWLKTLGLKEPDTLDDLHSVLKAFKEQDPNKNGQADEIPWSQSGARVGNAIGWSYGLHLQQNAGFYPDQNGKVQYDWINPKAKELLATLHQWYEEGLIDPGFANLTGEKFSSQIMNDMVGATVATAMTPEYNWNGRIREKTGNPESGLFPIVPPKGPYGDRIAEAMMAAASDGYFAITKDCKKPDLAIKWLDYASFSDDGIRFNEFGVEGLSYTMQNGKPVYTDKIVKSADGITVELFRIGALHYSIPQILTKEGRAAVFAPHKDLFDICAKAYEPAKSVPVFPIVLSTKEEADKLTSLMADINTYRDETIIKFITGVEPIDKFDTFVQTLKSLGIDEVIQIKQDQYDRYLKN